MFQLVNVINLDNLGEDLRNVKVGRVSDNRLICKFFELKKLSNNLDRIIIAKNKSYIIKKTNSEEIEFKNCRDCFIFLLENYQPIGI